MKHITICFFFFLFLTVSFNYSYGQDTVFAGNVTAKSFKINGTNGAGYLQLSRQTTPPSGITAQRMNIWFENSTTGNGVTDLIWRAGSWKRTFRTPVLSADRTYTFQNENGTVAFVDGQTLTNCSVKSDGLSADAFSVNNIQNVKKLRVTKDGQIVFVGVHADQAYSYAYPSEGGTLQIDNYTSVIVLSTPSNIDTFNLKMPVAPYDGQILKIATIGNNNITHLSHTSVFPLHGGLNFLNSASGGGEWIFTGEGWCRIK